GNSAVDNGRSELWVQRAPSVCSLLPKMRSMRGRVLGSRRPLRRHLDLRERPQVAAQFPSGLALIPRRRIDRPARSDQPYALSPNRWPPHPWRPPPQPQNLKLTRVKSTRPGSLSASPVKGFRALRWLTTSASKTLFTP